MAPGFLKELTVCQQSSNSQALRMSDWKLFRLCFHARQAQFILRNRLAIFDKFRRCFLSQSMKKKFCFGPIFCPQVCINI